LNIPYVTWQEAGAAAQILGIISSTDYKKNYKLDPKLPSDPKGIYSDFPGWTKFLGKEKREIPYVTWQESGAAAQILGIISSMDYKKNYKLDPKLPSKPKGIYSDFPGWIVFLGKKTDAKPYSTWQESGAAAQILGIISSTDYKKNYKLDPKLPSDPKGIYSDFPGWTKFLGKEKREIPYVTWQEASTAAQALDITSQSDYNKNYKKDPKLLSSLRDSYSDFPGWKIFLGK
jgi:hypothetical protein